MIKALARRVLATGPWYAALSRRADAGGTLLLTYHTIGPDNEDFDAWTVVRRSDFVRQVAWLRRHFDIVSIDDALRAPTGSRPRVVLTFDDGHSGWYDELLPIVEREALPVTLYVATSHIETGQPYWFDRVMNAVQLRSETNVDLGCFGLGQRRFGGARGATHWAGISALLENMKQLDSDELRDEVVGELERATRAAPKRRLTALRPTTVEHLRQVAANPWVTIGAHSDDHRLLDRMPLTEARASLARCRSTLEAWTSREVRHMAFPNGNFNRELSNLVAEMGFASAATTQAGRHRLDADVYALPRVFVGRWDDLDRFKLALVGL